MVAYYNEFDPFAAAWLRELIKDGLIAPGDVDERSIEDVSPTDLKPYTQCHFFAGIGGWSLALRMAGWPDDRPVFTGSAPCQPYSSTGKRKGPADERHLWPAFLWHIQQCRPAVVFGEQVASSDAMRWWDLVATDLEGEDYACAAANLCAAGVGAPHVRQRLFWVANSNQERRRWRRDLCRGNEVESKNSSPVWSEDRSAVKTCSSPKRLVNPNSPQCEKQPDSVSTVQEYARIGCGNFWGDAEYIPCADGKYRPTKSSIFPLAHGVPNRVGALRGAGNAIVPQVAKEFIEAAWSVINV